LNDRNIRSIQFSSKDSTSTIDLLGYLLKNDISCNPYLYPCDNIYISYATQRVFINAPTRSIISGWIPIKERETLSEFLSFFKFDASADTTVVVLQSSTTTNTRFTKHISIDEAHSIILQDRDVITIPLKKNYAPTILVSVSGEVQQPGLFPIIRDSTTTSDLIQMAGGLTQYADMSRAVIVRWNKMMDERIIDTLKAAYAPTIVRPEMISGISKMSLLKDYAIVDINNSGRAVKLFANDNIIIPSKDNSVYISGNVKKPGSYPFFAGKPYRFYINLAGGFTGKADKINVFGIRTFGTIAQITDLSEIRTADIIVVPDSQQSKFLIYVILPILQTAATIISVFLAMYSISH
jgi:protein involved in polysaccharide export with SLBB domain